MQVNNSKAAIVRSVLGIVSHGVLTRHPEMLRPDQTVDQAVENMIATAPAWAKVAILLGVLAGATKATLAADNGVRYGVDESFAMSVLLRAAGGDLLDDLRL